MIEQTIKPQHTFENVLSFIQGAHCVERNLVLTPLRSVFQTLYELELSLELFAFTNFAALWTTTDPFSTVSYLAGAVLHLLPPNRSDQ